MQVLLASVLIDALHAALEHGEVALDGVRVDDAAHVLLGGMSGHLVVCKRGADLRVDGGLIGAQRRFLDDVLFDDWTDRFGLEIIHDNGADLAAILIHERDDLRLVMKGALLRLAGFAADEGLVGFHNAASAGHAVDATERG